VDVTETAYGDRYVLRRYLDMAVYFDPLAVQGSSRPGGDICGESLPNIPGVDEAAGCPHAQVGPVQVVKYLPAKVPGHQRRQ
jgi:hypothetical protein